MAELQDLVNGERPLSAARPNTEQKHPLDAQHESRYRGYTQLRERYRGVPDVLEQGVLFSNIPAIS